MPSKLIKTIAKWLLNLAGVPEEKKTRTSSAAKKKRPAKRTAKKPSKKKPAKKNAVKTAKPKKAAPKPAKIKPVKPAPRKLEKPVKAAKPVKTAPVKAVKVKEAAPGPLVGTITHYFPKAGAAVLKVEKTEIKTGANILIQGEKTNLKMTASSIQINRIPVPSGRPGEDIGIGVKKEVAPGDKVYLIER